MPPDLRFPYFVPTKFRGLRTGLGDVCCHAATDPATDRDNDHDHSGCRTECPDTMTCRLAAMTAYTVTQTANLCQVSSGRSLRNRGPECKRCDREQEQTFGATRG